MTIRNLDSLFAPHSIAVFGASNRANSVGGTAWRNLRHGRFSGPVHAVNPKYRTLDGDAVVARAADLPIVPDLAVICSPASTVPGLIAELGALGTRAAIVLSAGLDAAGKQAMLDAARPHMLRILGPNCIGLLVPHLGVNASFAHLDALAGPLAFVTQSGALMTAMLDWAGARAIGFSHLVSLGEHADVDFGDVLDYLASDPGTRAILLYIESVTSPRKFMSAARAAARNKPVIVVKAGRSLRGASAAASHTGALAGSDLAYEAAIARAGMLRVDTLQQLFLAAETLTRFRTSQADKLLIVTNGGGAGVMAADAAEHMGVTLATLSPATLEGLNAVLPTNWSHANPLDIIGDAPISRYLDTMAALQGEFAHSAMLFIHAPTAIVESNAIAQALAPLASAHASGWMGCWLGDAAVRDARHTFQNAGIACYDTPEQAVRAFQFGVAYRRNQAQLLETPPATVPGAPPDTQAARTLVLQAIASGRTMLSELEAKLLLRSYHIETVPTTMVPAEPDAAANAADLLGFPVALKILSPDISHKSDVGGVCLHLESVDAVHAAARSMLARVRQERPDAHIDGFTVQPMVRRTYARELIVGATVDRVFGPLILFGQGGTSVEVVADRAVALPPLNIPLARMLVERTRVARLLKGWRDTPPADVDALYRVLVAVSQMLADIPELAELDINPLVLNHEGAIALDARVRVAAEGPGGAGNFAIRPYPGELVEKLVWRDQTLTLRPVRPEDEEQHRAFLAGLNPEDIRMRVFYSRRSIEHTELARMTQIDYAREMVFLAVAEGPAHAPGTEQTLGVVRAITDPDNLAAEFGIIVSSSLKGGGLGELLMNKMIRYLRAQGTKRLVATVLGDNHRMLKLAYQLGFTNSHVQPEHGVRAIEMDLQGARSPD